MKSQPGMTPTPRNREENRQGMPECAAFVDEMRAVFGEGIKVKYAEEGGQTIGQRFDEGVVPIMEQSLEDYLAERNAALAAMDMQWARRSTSGVSDEVLLVAMHKARVEVATMKPELRHESMAWLKDLGCSRMGGLPWPADGGLPE